MLRRIFLALILVLTLSARADNWVHHQPFGGVDGIAETSHRVYYTSLGALYGYDKRESETLVFSPQDFLNDVGVSGIYANVNADAVAVAYASGNIDIIRDDGSIVNLPDIKSSRLSPRGIYDIAFAQDMTSMCVGTGFGAVIFDLKRCEVSRYLRTPHPVTAVSLAGSDPVIFMHGMWLVLPEGAQFEKLDSWKEVQASDVQTNNEGVTVKDVPSTINATCVSASGGLSKVWVGTAEGLCLYDLSSPQPMLKAGPLRPRNMSVVDVNMLRMAPSGTLYMGTRGNSNVHVNRSTGNLGRLCRMSSDGVFEDLTPRSLSVLSGKLPDSSGRLFDLTFIREDPDDADLHYAGTLFEGFYALDGCEEVNHFYLDNTRFLDNWGVRVMDIAFDQRGGLWAYSEAPAGEPMMYFLPPEARNNIGEVAATNWTPVDFTSGVISGRDCTAVVSASGRYIYSMGSADIYVYDTKGTLSLSDDSGAWARSFVTSEGVAVPVGRVCCIMEDADDKSLWIGTDIGVVVAPRPWEVNDGAIMVSRPKVSRDDGTSLADYLLSTERIYGISTDALGNKWIATAASGAYLVNADGTSILQHFTSANSPLPDDEIRAVACRGDGTVFFGTSYGLVEYQSDNRPGTDNFEDISIYPNPVRPDYLGDVIIDGLPDGSIVKIVDNSGAVVAQLRSEGSRIRWNPRNGSRDIATGIYHIIASSADQGGRVVGKLAIVR